MKVMEVMNGGPLREMINNYLQGIDDIWDTEI